MVAAADERGMTVRLLGGIGIRLMLGAHFDPAFERPHHDIDAIIRRRDGRDFERLLDGRGWQPAREFNALNGSRRLLFLDPLSEVQVDVFVESFEMCHKLPLADRLSEPGPSLCATDLVMTKLQIVELNAKDRSDLYALLRGCELERGGPSSIEPGRVAELTSRDWGLHHTFELNLQRLLDGIAAGAVPDDDVQRVSAAIEAIQFAMDEVPKSRAWKMRARVGERRRWYELPEEVEREGRS